MKDPDAALAARLPNVTLPISESVSCRARVGGATGKTVVPGLRGFVSARGSIGSQEGKLGGQQPKELHHHHPTLFLK